MTPEHERKDERREPPKPQIQPKPANRSGILGINGLDTGDLMLLGLLYLLYRESGDEDFIIILVVMAFSILRPEKR